MPHDIQRVQTLPSPPERAPDSHKGTFGRALLIGGSRGMSGAVCLSGTAALRGGAGLVELAVPAGILPIVAGFEPSYLTTPLPEDSAGRIRLDASPLLMRRCRLATAVGVGPGLGQSSDLRALVRMLSATLEQPLVLDADALNALAVMPDVWLMRPRPEGKPAPRILTPHPGEFARLNGQPVGSDPSTREEQAAVFARDRQVVLVLKGHRTVITDGHRLAVNETGNSGMATGGTGDVLTGLITSLAGQGMPAFEAARLGAHLHGLAGDLAASDLSQPGLIASDLLRYLGPAWRLVLGGPAAVAAGKKT